MYGGNNDDFRPHPGMMMMQGGNNFDNQFQ